MNGKSKQIVTSDNNNIVNTTLQNGTTNNNNDNNNNNPLNLKLSKRDEKIEYAPSDPSFDRSKFSDAEFIELLLFENKELKSSLNRRNDHIGKLQNLLKSHEIKPIINLETPTATAFKNIDNKPSMPISSSLSSIKSDTKDTISSKVAQIPTSSSYNSSLKSNDLAIPLQTPLDKMFVVDGDIPQRSARRRPISHMTSDSINLNGERKASITSINSEIPKSTSTFSGLSTSTSHGDNLANQLSHNNDISSDRNVSQADTNSHQARENEKLIQQKKSPTSESPISQDRFGSSINSATIVGVDDNSNNSLVSEPTLASSNIGKTLPNTDYTSMKSSTLTQHKNSSNSSFSSYKSRIKLPPTLQHQQTQRENMNAKDLHINIVPEVPIDTDEQSQNNSLSHSNTESSLPSSLRSPALYDNSPKFITSTNNRDHLNNSSSNNNTNNNNNNNNNFAANSNNLDQGSIQSSYSTSQKFDSPNTQVSSQFLTINSNDQNRVPVPGTPDAFSALNNNISKFPSRMNDMNNQQDINSYLSSPIHQSVSSPRDIGYSENDTNLLSTPLTNQYMSTDSISGSIRPAAQTPGSSFNVIHTPKLEDDDVNLFIKPEEFQTINITVVSTISVHSKKSDDPNFTLSINDRASNKEMWRIRKSYTQLLAFDNEIRPIVDFFGLPPAPERALFNSTSPSKIEGRKESLQNYFNTIFLMPHIPHMVLYRICRYLSLDFVNPLDDFKSGAAKEGFLVRRYKGLGTTWKVRWCQVDGPYLEIYEAPGGTLLEQIKLKGTQIGRQSNDTVAEEKGYRHAFLILETTKATKLSSYAKHFFCAESDEERDDWINTLIDFNEGGGATITDNSFISNTSGDANAVGTVENAAFAETPKSKFDYPDDLEQTSKPYNSLSSNSLTPGLVNVNGNNDLESTDTIHSQDDQPGIKELAKDAKRAKKRSIFPFRYKASNSNQVNEDSNLDSPQTPSSYIPQTELVAPPSSGSGLGLGTGADPSIQLYLEQMNLDDDVTKAIFGREIVEAYELSNQEFLGKKIPSIIYRCLDFLTRTGGVYEEGIFRLSGSASTIRQLKDLFNTNFDLDLFESTLKPDMHTVAGLLKTYLRELPCPIMGLNTYNNIQNIIIAQGKNCPPRSLALLFRDHMNDKSNIDTIHYDVCYVIFRFLRQIIANNSSNRMNLRNVCIVFVPTLNVSLEILSTFLVDFDCIFEGSDPVPDENREQLDLQIPNF